MATHQKDTLVTDEIFHVFNRGVNRQEIFPDAEAHEYFLSLIDHCRRFSTSLSQHYKKVKFYGEELFLLRGPNFESFKPNKPPRFPVPDIPVEIHAYCLMPNHFHLLLKQLADGGISWFIQRICDSYTKAFNQRFGRTGPLWEGRFKAKQILDDYSYLQVMRYIHLNPLYSERLNLKTLLDHPYSSYVEAVGLKTQATICDHTFLRGLISSPSEYQEFVEAEISPHDQKILESLMIESAFD